MAGFTSYTTKTNDRWDLIAYQAYGAFRVTTTDSLGNEVEVDSMDLIIQANPSIPVQAILPDGLIIRIPVVDFVETKTDLLPPWKR